MRLLYVPDECEEKSILRQGFGKQTTDYEFILFYYANIECTHWSVAYYTQYTCHNQTLNNSFVNRFKRLPVPTIEGGESTIRVAIDTLTNEQVVVKKYHFDEGVPEAALNEIHVLSLKQIEKCRYIIRLIAFYQHNSEYLSILEKCQCDCQNKLILPQERLSLFKELAVALSILHSLNYAHRDLKPANFLISTDQVLKLADFGLCGRYDRPGGTKDFQAPENLLGKSCDKSSDIWSFGLSWLDIVCCGNVWVKFQEFLGQKGDYELSEKQELLLIQQLTDNNSVNSSLVQFLNKYEAQELETAIIVQCLQQKSENRPKVSQLLDMLQPVEIIPIVPKNCMVEEKEPIILDIDEAPLACYIEKKSSETQQSLDVCALEWSIQSDLSLDEL